MNKKYFSILTMVVFIFFGCNNEKRGVAGFELKEVMPTSVDGFQIKLVGEEKVPEYDEEINEDGTVTVIVSSDDTTKIVGYTTYKSYEIIKDGKKIFEISANNSTLQTLYATTSIKTKANESRDFYIDRIAIFTDEYKTNKGFCVGSLVSDVLKEYENNSNTQYWDSKELFGGSENGFTIRVFNNLYNINFIVDINDVIKPSNSQNAASIPEFKKNAKIKKIVIE
jgi:hypothetical protein